MSFKLPDLPYAKNALEPHISAETLDFHYGKHHKAYVDNLNKLVPGSAFEKKSLEEIITDNASKGAIFNNAAQIWNHSFYWQCLSPNGGGEPQGALAENIHKHFNSFAEFKQKFSATAAGTFGSGWAWLVKTENGSLEIVSTGNAGNPMTDAKKPLLTCDVWEHAYYIDYRNARPKYIEAFWNLVNWAFVARQFDQ
ncbi:MAG: Fe-Mn family superoxide dismutase [Pseudomonadota bacterium]